VRICKKLAFPSIYDTRALKVGVWPLRDVPDPSKAFKNTASKWDDPNYDPSKDTIDTDVPLHLAAYEGKLDEVKKLLAEGADVQQVEQLADLLKTTLLRSVASYAPE